MEDDEFSWDDPRTRSFGQQNASACGQCFKRWMRNPFKFRMSSTVLVVTLLRLIFIYFPQLSCSNYAKHGHVLCLKWSILFTAVIAPCFSSMFQDGVLGAVARPGTGRTLLEGVCRFVAGWGRERHSNHADHAGMEAARCSKQHGKMRRWLISHGVNYESTIFRMR